MPNLDWQEISKIIFTAVASAIFTGVLAFAAQRYIEKWFSRRLEKFKVDLQLGAFEHQTRFTKLHEKRAEVIAELYLRLVKTQRCFTSMLDPLPAEFSGDPRVERIKVARDIANNFLEYFDTHQLFLDPALCAKLSRLSQEFSEIYITFVMAQSDPTGSSAVHKAWSDGIDKLNKEIPKLRDEIEVIFRKMLGDTNSASLNMLVEGRHV